MSDSMVKRAFARFALDAEAKGTVGFFFILLLALSWLGVSAGTDDTSGVEHEQTDRCAVVTVTDPGLREDLLTQRWIVVDADHIRPPGCESAP